MLKLLFYLSFVIFFWEKDPSFYKDYNLKIIISNIKYSGKSILPFMIVQKILIHLMNL